MKYRADIDGLRCLAVLSVIFFHFRMFHFRAGFLGVDIFFVISGFLISSIIFAEIADTGRLSFSNFWLRRARRILPALFFMLTLVSAAAWIIFSGTTLLPEFSKTLLGAVLSGANFVFFFQTGYFDNNVATKPLLHTWSLGVEEQFYLIFPLLVFLCLVKLKLHKKVILPGLFLGIVLSCAPIFLLRGEEAAAFSFYMLPTRFWELLTGTTLAYMLSQNILPVPSKTAGNIIATIALALSAYALQEGSNTQGIDNVLVVLAAAGFIYARHSYMAAVFSLRPLVFVGKISYSLYLWHWPLFVFLTINTIKISSLEKVGLCLLSFLVAWASYHFIELPFRKKGVGWRKVRSRLLPAAVGLCALALAGIFLKIPPAFQTPNNADRRAFLAEETKTFTFNNANIFQLGPGGDWQFFVLGDSHSFCVKDALAILADEYNLTGGLLGSEVLFFNPEYQRERKYTANAALIRAGMEFIREKNIRFILLIQRWHAYIEGSEWEMSYRGVPVKHDRTNVAHQALQQGIQQLLDEGLTVFVMEQAPEHPCKSIEMAAFLTHGSPTAPHDAKSSNLKRLLEEINNPNLIYLPIAYCFKGSEGYEFIKDGKMLYLDNNHLNFFGGLVMKDALRPFFEYIKTHTSQ